MTPTLLALAVAAGQAGQIHVFRGPGAVPGAAVTIQNSMVPTDAAVRRQQADPGMMTQPFQRVPVLRPVGPATDRGGAAVLAGNRWVKEFPYAAHFPLPRFDQNLTPVGADGLVIYEGMRLVVDVDTGEYDLELTAAIPETPVTVRLQLVFTRHAALGPTEYRLTIPPFRLEPDRTAQPGDPTTNNFHVHHRGYSSQLRSSIRTSDLPFLADGTWEVTRVGVARFGTPTALERDR